DYPQRLLDVDHALREIGLHRGQVLVQGVYRDLTASPVELGHEHALNHARLGALVFRGGSQPVEVLDKPGGERNINRGYAFAICHTCNPSLFAVMTGFAEQLHSWGPGPGALKFLPEPGFNPRTKQQSAVDMPVSIMASAPRLPLDHAAALQH